MKNPPSNMLVWGSLRLAPNNICIYIYIYNHEKSQFNSLVWGSLTLAPITRFKIALKKTPTLKLGLTPVMTVTQDCVFVNLCRGTTMPP